MDDQPKEQRQVLKHPLVVAAFVAVVGLIANTCVGAFAQANALKIEERRDRREVVLELLRQSDADAAVKKLRILGESGLLDDDDGRLANAVLRSRIGPPCEIDRALLVPPPKVGDRLTGDAQDDFKITAGSAVRLRAYADMLRSVLEACSVNALAGGEGGKNTR